MPLRRLTQALRHPKMLLRYPGAMREYRRFAAAHPDLGKAIVDVRQRRLTYLRPPNLSDLADVVLQAESRGIEGAVVEAGTALGGSAIVLAKAKNPSRPMKAYDTFGMIPPPSEHDGADVHERYERIVRGEASGLGGDEYYGYKEDLLGQVSNSLREFGVDPATNNIELVQGLYEEVMKVDYPVAIAHVDCDWYSSVKTCLDAIGPQIVPGGRFVIDDYEHWSGCTEAVDEFLAAHGNEYRREWHSRLHLVKG